MTLSLSSEVDSEALNLLFGSSMALIRSPTLSSLNNLSTTLVISSSERMEGRAETVGAEGLRHGFGIGFSLTEPVCLNNRKNGFLLFWRSLEIPSLDSGASDTSDIILARALYPPGMASILLSALSIFLMYSSLSSGLIAMFIISCICSGFFSKAMISGFASITLSNLLPGPSLSIRLSMAGIFVVTFLWLPPACRSCSSVC
mmetsp:Transcript_6687/g.13282  ORF Transcript_6687/g.13282 Transcript_6687/m.13282 type:complete len:202 (+) Transcript_6687:822-1427(+)